MPSGSGVVTLAPVQINKESPTSVSRLIVHQFDAARPTPGGIDTCIRGMAGYFDASTSVAIIGVDTGENATARVGSWELYTFRQRLIWFLPVARLDPIKPRKALPHSIRLVLGFLRFRNRLPEFGLVQSHSLPVAIFLAAMRLKPISYFIHTQGSGLVSQNSDSFWRYVRALYPYVERKTASKVDSVVVFNEEHASRMTEHNRATMFSPTWFDPDLVGTRDECATSGRILWVGRIEPPKDPLLAIQVMEVLESRFPGEFSLTVQGVGSLYADLCDRVGQLPEAIAKRIKIAGRVAPKEVAEEMAASELFLMTSYPGYEGFSRSLVEALATGLPAVATVGSDTGGLIEDGVSGYNTSRSPEEIAQRLVAARTLRTTDVQRRVASFSAPAVISRIESHTKPA